MPRKWSNCHRKSPVCCLGHQAFGYHSFKSPAWTDSSIHCQQEVGVSYYWNGGNRLSGGQSLVCMFRLPWTSFQVLSCLCSSHFFSIHITLVLFCSFNSLSPLFCKAKQIKLDVFFGSGDRWLLRIIYITHQTACNIEAWISEQLFH